MAEKKCNSSNVIGVSGLCENKKVLKEFEKCVPIRQVCNGPSQTIYQSLVPSSPDAVVSITNDSDCIMHVHIIGAFGSEDYELRDHDSVVAVVGGLNRINVRCTDYTPIHSPFCSGTLDLDLAVGLRF